MGMITTSLPDMEVYTSSTTEEMSTIFIWTGVADIVGTLLIGPLFDRVNGMLLLALCLLAECVSIALAPIWRSLIVFHAMVTLNLACDCIIFSGE